MNRMFAAMRKYVVVYLDDILIFSESPEEHAKHLDAVLSLLEENNFYAKLTKCEFNQPEVKYLGHIVGRDGIKLDSQKLAAVQEWPAPNNIHQLRCFLGLTNYFRKFVQGYAARAKPLTGLLKKTARYIWTEHCQQAFDGLKKDLTTAPVLKSPNPNDPFEVIADACGTGIGAVLMQEGRPCAFESRGYNDAEANYTVTEQEQLAVVHAMKAWRYLLEGIPQNNLQLVTDHNPLVWLQTQPILTRRQARWMEYLSRFNHRWQYRPGRLNVADPVSRRPHGLPVAALTRAHAPKAEEVDPAPTAVTIFQERIQEGYLQDPWFASENTRMLHKKHDLWWRKNAIAVPNHGSLREEVLKEFHDVPYSGHVGVNRMTQALQKNYWWPHFRDDILHPEMWQVHLSSQSTAP